MSFKTRKFHFFHISGYVFKDEIQVTGLEFTWKKLKKKLSLKFGKINGTGRWNLSIVCVVIFFFCYLPSRDTFCSCNLASVSFLQMNTGTF